MSSTSSNTKRKATAPPMKSSPPPAKRARKEEPSSSSESSESSRDASDGYDSDDAGAVETPVVVVPDKVVVIFGVCPTDGNKTMLGTFTGTPDQCRQVVDILQTLKSCLSTATYPEASMAPLLEALFGSYVNEDSYAMNRLTMSAYHELLLVANDSAWDLDKGDRIHGKCSNPYHVMTFML